MAFNVTEFVKALPCDGQRSNLFNVQFGGVDPVDIGVDGAMAPLDLDLLTFRACSFKFDGVRKIIVRVIEDEDFSSLALLRKYKESTWPNIKVNTYCKNGAVSSEHSWSVIKTSIAWGTELAWDDDNNFMTWTVTMDIIQSIP